MIPTQKYSSLLDHLERHPEKTARRIGSDHTSTLHDHQSRRSFPDRPSLLVSAAQFLVCWHHRVWFRTKLSETGHQSAWYLYAPSHLLYDECLDAHRSSHGNVFPELGLDDPNQSTTRIQVSEIKDVCLSHWPKHQVPPVLIASIGWIWPVQVLVGCYLRHLLRLVFLHHLCTLSNTERDYHGKRFCWYGTFDGWEWIQ